MRPTEFWIPDETQRERICDGAARIVSAGLFRARGAVYENLMRYVKENEELFKKINALSGQVTIHDNKTLHREVPGASGMRYLLAVVPRR